MSELSEMDKLKARLFPKDGSGPGVRNIKIFPGDGPATPEQLARAMNRFFDAAEAGELEEVTEDEDND